MGYYLRNENMTMEFISSGYLKGALLKQPSTNSSTFSVYSAANQQLSLFLKRVERRNSYIHIW